MSYARNCGWDGLCDHPSVPRGAGHTRKRVSVSRHGLRGVTANSKKGEQIMKRHPLDYISDPATSANYKFQEATGSQMSLWHWIYIGAIVIGLVLGI